MPKIRVGVLRGGPSAEHEVSLLTGINVLSNLPSEKYQGTDILISREGKWPYLPAVDVIFNALHGEYGEDGQVQLILEKNICLIPVPVSRLRLWRWTNGLRDKFYVEPA